MASVTLPQTFEAPATPTTLKLAKREQVMIGAHIIAALTALMFGIFMGPFQTFHRSPTFVQYFPTIPVFTFYYQAVTAHGVMNALFFTTFFIIGFSYFVTERSLQRPIKSTPMGWAPSLRWRSAC